MVPIFEGLCGEFLPEVEYFNIVDEGVLRLVLRDGGVTPPLVRRLCDSIGFAEEVAADFILVARSSTSPTVDFARYMVEVPIYKIDQPMIDRAIETGNRIGILAPVRTTLSPTAFLTKDRIDALGHTADG